jgi:hypothetical protein
MNILKCDWATGVVIGVVLLGSLLRSAEAGAQVADPKFSLEAWGDVVYSRFDYGPDQKSGDNGSPPDSRALVDLAFFVTELKYYFSPRTFVEAEIEYEHGGTGSSLELEYEEFGEYEVEIEKGGEVRLEELYLSWQFARAFNLRAGHFVTAVGLVNSLEKPTTFFTAVRSESEVSLIPASWDETGVEVFGAVSRLSYRLQLVNGLDSSGFSSKFWIRDGHQMKFETVRATDLAVVGRLDWQAAAGVTLGGSCYYGNTTGNRPRPDMKGIDGHLLVLDAHALLERGPLRGTAMYMTGSLENADLISAKNSRLSTNLQASRTPVAKGAYAWNVQLGFDVTWLFKRNAPYRIFPFASYEQYNTMATVDAGTFADPRFDRTVATAGINFFPNPDVVIKLDVSHRSFGSDRLNNENTIAVAVGFAAELLDL